MTRTVPSTPPHPPQLPLSIRFGAPIITIVIILLVYLVFIPQISELNSFQEDVCTYVRHDVKEKFGDDENNNSGCYPYTIYVRYEHAHDTAHKSPHVTPTTTSTKHQHEGMIEGVKCDVESEKQVSEWIVNKFDHSEKKKTFTCFVNEIDPEHQIYLEKPSGSNMMHTVLLLFGLGGGVIYLLQCYVDWSNKQKKTSTTTTTTKQATKATKEASPSNDREKKRKSKKIE